MISSNQAMEKNHLNDYEIFTDFDGTITLLDTNVELVNKYGSEQTKLDEELFIKGDLPNRVAIIRHYQTMRLTPDAYYDTVYSLPLDPGFPRFYKATRDLGMQITVLSGSIGEGIERYLTNHGFDDIMVYGNNMSIENGYIAFKTADSVSETYCGKGLCAHCKSKHLDRARQDGKKTIYIGDGLTDICAARHADIVFAKGALADWCDKNGIPFVGFNNYDDLCNRVFGEGVDNEES